MARRSANQSLPRVFVFAFSGVGLLLIAIAALLFYFDQRAMSLYTPVEGVVIRNQPMRGMVRPVFRYTWQGKEELYFSTTYTNPPAFDVGEKVTLYVNPSGTNDVMVDSFSERFLAMTIVGGIGLFFIGFIMLFNYLWSK
jgi:hypothetical protein